MLNPKPRANFYFQTRPVPQLTKLIFPKVGDWCRELKYDQLLVHGIFLDMPGVVKKLQGCVYLRRPGLALRPRTPLPFLGPDGGGRTNA